MGYRDRYQEEGFTEYIREIIDADMLDGDALGIAKQVADRGIESLTPISKYPPNVQEGVGLGANATGAPPGGG